MNTQMVLEVGQQTIVSGLMVVSPVMLVGFTVGLVVSFFQAVMQMQEMTLAFVPKLLAICVALVIFGGWMVHQLVSFTQSLLIGIPQLIGL